ncbi:hypothetical protein SDC9_157840 [bioreactor metagenome]|uniref:Uncharacterized protein n=1 Tax=bioreactor metagenome TaxID=1076179 RepID=A0A645F851_9ZZZZ
MLRGFLIFGHGIVFAVSIYAHIMANIAGKKKELLQKIIRCDIILSKKSNLYEGRL